MILGRQYVSAECPILPPQPRCTARLRREASRGLVHLACGTPRAREDRRFEREETRAGGGLRNSLRYASHMPPLASTPPLSSLGVCGTGLADDLVSGEELRD